MSLTLDAITVGSELEKSSYVPSDYHELTPDELTAQWHSLTSRETVFVSEVLSTFTKPLQGTKLRGALMVDLCEVLRETGMACRQELNEQPTDVSTSNYWGVNRGIAVDKNDLDLVRSLMNKGSVRPIKDYGKIMRRLRSIHEMGVAIVSVTATLEGCEAATIDDRFLGEAIRHGIFDGIMFARGHMGGRVPKAQALKFAMEQIFDMGADAVPVAAIDDSTHHLDAFKDVFANNPNLELRAPRHEGNAHLPASQKYLVDSPLAAFDSVHTYFQAVLQRGEAA